MSQKKEPAHALLVRLGKYELQALGIPAIMAVVVCAVILARWCGVL